MDSAKPWSAGQSLHGQELEALRESEERLKLALAGSDEGVWDWNIVTGDVHFSRRWMEMLEYLPGELEGNVSTWEKLVHPDDMPMVMAVLQKHLDGETPFYETEHRLLTKSGEWKWILDRGKVMERDADGNAVRAAGTHTDIDERKKAEAVRERLEARLRKASRMEAIGQLAGGLAHDFNNLLTVILGNTRVLSDMARDGVTDAAVLREAVNEVDRAAHRGASLTRSLLAFSRKQVTRAEVLDLNRVLADMERMFARLIRDDIVLNVELCPEPQCVKADPGQLSQILMNLVVNAGDAMTGGGTLELRVSRVRLDAEAVRGVKAGPYCVLTVKDTGEGMDAATRDRVFEPFFTTKTQGKGTGLGLSTVYGIVRQAGGFVAVESEPGRGSTFAIHLPAVEEAVVSREDLPRDGAAPTGTETVLLCEDEDLVRRLLERVLVRHGYRVLVASSGSAALDVAKKHDGAIDLVITDVVMPHMSGPVLAEKMRAALPGIRVLFVSGYGAEELDGYEPLPGRTEFLEKPFQPEELMRRARALLDREPT